MSDSTTALLQPTIRTARVDYLKSLRMFGYASTYFERALPLGSVKGVDNDAEMKLRVILEGIEAIANRPATSIGRVARVELTLDRRGSNGRCRTGALLYSSKHQEPILYVQGATFGSRDFDGVPVVDGTHMCVTLLETLRVKRSMIDELSELVRNDSYTIVLSREPFIQDVNGETVLAPHGGVKGTWTYWLSE